MERVRPSQRARWWRGIVRETDGCLIVHLDGLVAMVADLILVWAQSVPGVHGNLVHKPYRNRWSRLPSCCELVEDDVHPDFELECVPQQQSHHTTVCGHSHAAFCHHVIRHGLPQTTARSLRLNALPCQPACVSEHCNISVRKTCMRTTPTGRLALR